MIREVGRVLAFALLLAAAAVDRGASVRGAQGLDTVIHELPRHVIDVRRMVEAIGQQCGFEVILDDKVCGEISVERLPATGRSILTMALPGRGFLYVVEGRVLRVMPAEKLRAYFRTRAVSRSYAARVTPGLLSALMETPDVVSTMGYLRVDAEHGAIRVHDLPWFVNRVEEILVTWGDHEALITL